MTLLRCATHHTAAAFRAQNCKLCSLSSGTIGLDSAWAPLLAVVVGKWFRGRELGKCVAHFMRSLLKDHGLKLAAVHGLKYSRLVGLFCFRVFYAKMPSLVSLTSAEAETPPV